MNCDINIYFQVQFVHDFDCWSHINHFGENFVTIWHTIIEIRDFV